MKFNKIAMCCVSILALSTSTAFAGDYVVMANGNSINNKMINSIEATGATITGTLPQVGMIFVSSDDEDFRAKAKGVKGVRSAFVNLESSAIVPDMQALNVSEMAVSPPNTNDDDFFFDLQWGHDAVDAPEAWEAGFRGTGVRVAVIDSGIDSSHPDLAPNLNTTLSASFVPGETFDGPPGSHGTHVAGTIGAADNAFGVIGVAPEVELVSLKALSAFTGSGATSGIWQAMVYAADIDADVINMSLGITGGLPQNCTFGTTHFPASDCAEIFIGYNRVTQYVNKAGSTIIASAGNDGRDTNHDGSIKSLPAQANHVISVSATAPYLWGVDQTTDLDILSSYSTFGKNGVDLAAPGGDFDVFFDFGSAPCNGPVVPGRPCYLYDMVLSTTPGGWSWNAGTSMAAPHASGVAALIIGANGGDMAPNKVYKALRQGADDLGQPGKDDHYGHGRVNAAGSTID